VSEAHAEDKTSQDSNPNPNKANGFYLRPDRTAVTRLGTGHDAGISLAAANLGPVSNYAVLELTLEHGI
jgi:hypothetical protein